MGGRADERDLSVLGAANEGRDSGRLLADPRLALVVERPLERAHVEVHPLHVGSLYAGGRPLTIHRVVPAARHDAFLCRDAEDQRVGGAATRTWLPAGLKAASRAILRAK